MNRALLIANPGSRRGARLVEPARDAFRRAGVNVDVVLTEARGHGARVVRESVDRYDTFFALGGDGTAMEIVDALVGTGRPVGILPGGTGNLLAHALHIPRDVSRAVPALLAGTVRRIDLAMLGNGTRFAVAAGIGVDAEMIARAPLALRRRYGVLAYFASATSALTQLTPFNVRAAVDGKVVERDDCVLAMIVNVGSVLGGLFELGPGIAYDDGMLDLCIYSARSLAGGVTLAARLALKRHDHPRMAFARGATVTLEATPVQRGEADGEMIGSTPITATVEPLAAPLLIPVGRS